MLNLPAPNQSRALARTAIGCLVLGQLAACGGAGEGASSGSSSVSAPPVTTTAATRVAQIELLGNGQIENPIATATGIYGVDTSGTTDKVMKWQSTSGARGWLSAGLPVTSGAFAPLQLEDDAGVLVMWAGRAPTSYQRFYSLSNAAAEDDISIYRIIPGGLKTSQRREWLITLNGVVYIKSTGFGQSRLASENYTKVYATGDSSLGLFAAVADETDLKLYAASGRTLYRIGADKKVTTWEFPSSVNTLISTLGATWIGAGTTIYKMTGDSIVQYAVLPNLLLGPSPMFCINKQDLYAANSTVYKGIQFGAAPEATPFLASSDLGMTSAQQQLVIQAKVGFGSFGVYCGNGVDANIFTKSVVSATPPVFTITRVLPL